jgi:acetyltransferase
MVLMCLTAVATPPQTVPGIIAELGSRGTGSAVVITAGVRDDLKRAMLEAARPYCLRIQGPNCLGLMVPGLGLNAGFSHQAPLAGDVAFLSQSGALITAIVDWARGHGIGFSHIVLLGDMADADFGDLLDYLAGDTKSRAILLYTEAVTHARKFLSAARRAARSKPVIVVKAGREATGAKAALSHTGALAGADAAYEAAFRRAGLLRVLELHDLFSAAEILARHPRLAGERLAILTNGGGAGVLAADRHAERRIGHQLPDGARFQYGRGRGGGGYGSTAVSPLCRVRQWPRSTRPCRLPGRVATPSTSSAMPAPPATRMRSMCCWRTPITT